MKKHIIILLFFTGLLSSCVDPYWPEIDKYVDNLAIDGLINNDPGPYYVRLQLSTTIYHPQYNPLSNATVFVTDDLGNVENFFETENGVYTNVSPDFQGEIGRSYQLTVSMSENQIYQSGWEKINEPLGIESVYAEIEDRVETNIPYNVWGYQFYIDTKKSLNDSTYLIWRVESTYKYISDFKCWHYYDGSIKTFPKTDSLKTCWKTEIVPKVMIGSTQSTKENQLKRYPLHYVSTEGRELAIRYSILVNQYTVNESVFKYWDAVQHQNDIQGDLYTQQPYQIQGNMANVNNPDEPVAGCFVAAGISTKRVFYDKPPLKFNYTVCVLGEFDFERMQDLAASRPSEWPIYLTMGPGYAIAYPNQECVDCRRSGGYLEKPDFWTDN